VSLFELFEVLHGRPVTTQSDKVRAVATTLPALLDNDDPALFPKLTDEQLSLLHRHGHVRSIQVGEVLFQEGDTTYEVMVLLEGRVEVVVGSGDVFYIGHLDGVANGYAENNRTKEVRRWKARSGKTEAQQMSDS
jgi:hypothetical protein